MQLDLTSLALAHSHTPARALPRTIHERARARRVRYDSLVCCARESIDAAGQCCYGEVDCAVVCRGASRLCCGTCKAPPIGFCPSAGQSSACDPANPAAAPTYTLYPTRAPTTPRGGGGGGGIVEPGDSSTSTVSTTEALAVPIMLLGVIAFLLATISLVRRPPPPPARASSSSHSVARSPAHERSALDGLRCGSGCTALRHSFARGRGSRDHASQSSLPSRVCALVLTLPPVSRLPFPALPNSPAC